MDAPLIHLFDILSETLLVVLGASLGLVTLALIGTLVFWLGWKQLTDPAAIAPIVMSVVSAHHGVVPVGGGGDFHIKMPGCICLGFINGPILNDTFSCKTYP